MEPIKSTQSGKEKRRYPRHTFNALVDFVRQNHLYKETADNLSESGIFIRSNNPAQYMLNERVTLSFQTSDGKPHKYTGEIVRKNESGIGIHFI